MVERMREPADKCLTSADSMLPKVLFCLPFVRHSNLDFGRGGG